MQCLKLQNVSYCHFFCELFCKSGTIIVNLQCFVMEYVSLMKNKSKKDKSI